VTIADIPGQREKFRLEPFTAEEMFGSYNCFGRDWLLALVISVNLIGLVIGVDKCSETRTYDEWHHENGNGEKVVIQHV